MVLTAMILSQSFSGSSSMRAMVITPAFWIETSILPNFDSARSYRASTSVLFVTSQTYETALDPRSAEFLRHRVDTRFVGGEHKIGALVRKALGYPLSNTPACAGNHYSALFESFHLVVRCVHKISC